MRFSARNPYYYCTETVSPGVKQEAAPCWLRVILGALTALRKKFLPRVRPAVETK